MDLTAVMKFTLAIQKAQVEIGKIYRELNSNTDETLEYLESNKEEYFVPVEVAADTFSAFARAEQRRFNTIDKNITAARSVIEEMLKDSDSDKLTAFSDAVEYMADENYTHHNIFVEAVKPYRAFIDTCVDGIPRDTMLDIFMSLSRLSRSNLQLTVGCFKKVNKAYEDLTGTDEKSSTI